MISPNTKQRNSNSKKGHRPKPSEVRARTVQLLTQEIEFIDNPEFRNFNSSQLIAEAKRLLREADPRKQQSKQLFTPQLNALCSYALLGKEEETNVFRVMNFLKYQANSLRSALDPSRPSIRKNRIVEECLALAIDLRNHAVRANTRLVVSIAKSFVNDKNDLDELVSEGLSCLVRVVEKFDYGRGFRFSTYATWGIRNRMLRAREQTQRYETRFRSGAAGQSLDVLSEVDPQIVAAENQEMWGIVHDAMSVLNERERLVIEARSGFRDLDCKPTFKNLGLVLGVCKERVRQIERNGLDKLQRRMDELKLGNHPLPS